MVAPEPLEAPRRNRDDLLRGLAAGKPGDEQPRQVRREVVPAAELQEKQKLSGDSPIGRGASQRSKLGRIEKAAPAQRGIRRRNGLIAVLAPRCGGKRNRIPAAVANSSAKKGVERSLVAEEATRGKEKRGRGARPRAQIFLRARASSSVDIAERRFSPFEDSGSIGFEFRSLNFELSKQDFRLLAEKR